jgi:carboxymethylenebutenolidase
MDKISLPVTITNPEHPEADGDEFGAYLAKPSSGSGPGIVLLHEIFGVTGWIKDTADLFAAQGYCVAAPEMFWRLERNFAGDFWVPEQRQKGFEFRGRVDHDKAISDIAATIAYLKSLPECNGKIGVTGFCTGGTMTYLSAARLEIDAAVAYYGTQIHEFLEEGQNISCPTILHAGTSDEHVSLEVLGDIKEALAPNPNITIHEYDAGHAFANTERDTHFVADATAAAHAHTYELFNGLK